MYERFFNLKERPFSLTPDPDYLYLSRNHTEALSYLRYGLEGHAGFAVVTGEIGSGKTTLLQTALRRLDQQTSVARLMNTQLDARELLEAVLLDFGLEAASTGSKPQMLRELASFLVEERNQARLAVLVIDEAQNLGMPALEEVRMLSNLETEKSKLIQVVLVGQPSLRDKLARPELEQLKQRISVSYHLSELDADDTAAYIDHRLRRASADPSAAATFPAPVAALIHEYSAGVPRQINIIADAVLLSAYAEERPEIDLDIAIATVRDLEHTGVVKRRRRGTTPPARQREEPRVEALAVPPVSTPTPIAAPTTSPSTSTAAPTPNAFQQRITAPAPRRAPAGVLELHKVTAAIPRERAAFDDMRPGPVPDVAVVSSPRRVGIGGLIMASATGGAIVLLGLLSIDPAKTPRGSMLEFGGRLGQQIAADIASATPVGTTASRIPPIQQTTGPDPDLSGASASNEYASPSAPPAPPRTAAREEPTPRDARQPRRELRPSFTSEIRRTPAPAAMNLPTAPRVVRGEAASETTRSGATSVTAAPALSAPVTLPPSAPPASVPPAVNPASASTPAEPPVARAASPSLASTPAAPVVDTAAAAAAEERSVRMALSEYRSAYNRLDASAAKDVWPSVDVRALSRAFDRLRSQEVAFTNCHVSIAGDRANARCGGNASYVPKVGSNSARSEPRQWAFDLRKAGDRWTIATVETR